MIHPKNIASLGQGFSGTKKDINILDARVIPQCTLIFSRLVIMVNCKNACPILRITAAIHIHTIPIFRRPPAKLTCRVKKSPAI